MEFTIFFYFNVQYDDFPPIHTRGVRFTSVFYKNSTIKRP